MSNYGLKISRPGYDVKTTDDQNLVFSSSFNTLKVYRSIYFSEEGSEPHGLTYPPTFLFFTPFENDAISPGNGAESVEGKYMWRQGNKQYYGNWRSLVEVDDTNVYSDGQAYVILFIDPLDE